MKDKDEINVKIIKIIKGKKSVKSKLRKFKEKCIMVLCIKIRRIKLEKKYVRSERIK